MPTVETLFLLVLSILAMESVGSIRLLYRHFLLEVTKKSLNAFYYACSYMQFILLMLYAFKWLIEVSYYEQKTFWPLCSYMVRSRKGIEMLINLINIAYCAMKLLPYQDESFAKYRTESVQEFRFALSGQIRQQVFYAIFVKNIETRIKSDTIMNALKQLIQQQGYHL